MSKGWVRWMAVLVAFVVLAACSGDGGTSAQGDPAGEPDTAAASEATVNTTDSTVPERPADMLDCEWRGEPCTLGEVPADVLEATDALLHVATDYLGAGMEPAALAEALAGVESVAETGWDQLGVFLRVDDGPPAWAMLDELDGRAVEGGWIGDPGATGIGVRAPSVTAALAAPVGRGMVYARAAGGSGGIAGTPGEGKRALVVSPYAFGMTTELGPYLEGFRDFGQRGGRVDVRVREDAVAPTEALAPFLDWTEFDTIVLATHGLGVCEQADDGTVVLDDAGNHVGCRTVLAAGEVTGTLEDAVAAIGDTPGVIVTRKTGRARTDLPGDELYQLLVDVCLPAMAAKPTYEGMETCREPIPETEPRPVQVGLTADFFATAYPGGLPDRLVILTGCQSLRFDDIASGLLGGVGAVIGYPEIVFANGSAQARGDFVGRLALGYPVAHALAANADEHPAGEVGGAHLVHIGNDTLRAVDVVALMAGENELADGGFVASTITDDDEPAVEMVVRVARVGDDESPGDFTPEIWIDGEPALRGVTLTTESGDQWFSETVAVPLPATYRPGDTFDAEVRVALPAGGESKWRYEDLRTGVSIRYRSHVRYVFPTHTGEGVMVAEGPLEQGPDGWQASLPMRWESAELSGVQQCRTGEMIAHSVFEVISGEMDGDSASLRWGVDVGGDGTEIRDRIVIECDGVGGDLFAGVIAQGIGAALGVAGMIVIHGPDPAAMAWVADDFVASDEPGVLLEHRQTGSFEEIDAEVTIQLIAGQP